MDAVDVAVREGGGGAPPAGAMAGTKVSVGMLWACIVLFLSPTLDAPCVAGGGGGGAPSASAMAGIEVSVGMLWASRVLPRAEAAVRWEADCNMSGSIRSVHLRLYNRRVAFRGLGGGLMPFTVISSHSHHLSLKTTYTTK